MLNTNFSQDHAEKHTCIGHQEGDWIIFTCPECDYQRKMNWVTGETKTNNKNNNVLHRGEHFPVMVHQMNHSMN